MVARRGRTSEKVPVCCDRSKGDFSGSGTDFEPCYFVAGELNLAYTVLMDD